MTGDGSSVDMLRGLQDGAVVAFGATAIQGLEEGAGAIIEHGRALYKKLATAREGIFMQEFGP